MLDWIWGVKNTIDYDHGEDDKEFSKYNASSMSYFDRIHRIESCLSKFL